MIRVINNLWLIFLILNNSCNSNFKMKEKQLLIKSNKLSKKFIIVDGHIDLPYRLKEAGYLKKNKIFDLTKETDGDFDYAKSKRGGLDAPFMSIYIPAEFQKSGGAKKLADSLINLVVS